MKETLCWKCANACGGCSWSNHWEHTPVSGWTATPTKLRLDNDKNGGSYIVFDCPEYVPDKLPTHAPKTIRGGWDWIALKNCQKQG